MPKCADEWNPARSKKEEGVVAIDANGNKLADGDIGDPDQRFESEGCTERFQTSTRENIRIVEGDHNIVL